MIRYRCPHCAALIAAHERRVGQSSVCKACVKLHRIPSDESLWLDETGQPLRAPSPEAGGAPEPGAMPDTNPAIELPSEAVAYQAQLAPTVLDMQLPESADSLANTPAPAATPEPKSEPQPVAASASHGRAGHGASHASPADEADAPDSGGVATKTPPALPTRARVLPAARSPRQPGPPPAPVEQAEPVQLQTQADIAVALTAALTRRMKPRAAPRRDLRLSTASWMLLTGVSLTMILATVFTRVDLLLPATLLGVAQILAGYVWIVLLTHSRGSTRGLVCAIPPLTFYYLGQYKYAKYRPLRFVATGAALVLICLAVSPLVPRVHAILHRKGPAPEGPSEVAARSKLEQLRAYREQRSYDALIRLLDQLAKTDPLLSEDAKDRAALSEELRLLCGHALTDVRVQAMAAYARWNPEGAREVCLAAVRSSSYEERRMALRLLPQWKDHDTARAVQTLINRQNTAESNQAQAALEEIGGPAAEQAAMALFRRVNDQPTKLTALTILEKVGGPESVEWLRATAMAADDATIREKALAVANAIEIRLRGPAP
jgi:hypothetical protein